MTDPMDRLRAADPVPEPPAAPPVEWLVARLEAAARASGETPAGALAPPPSALAPQPHRAPAATGVPSPRPVARRARVLVPVFVAALAVAVVVLLGRGSSPDVIAEARTALGTPDEIIHTVLRTEHLGPDGRRLSPGQFMGQGEMSDRSERWAALNPLRTRSRMTILPRGGGAPWTVDNDYAAGVSRSAWSWNDVLHQYTLPPDHIAAYEALANTRSSTTLDATADPVAGIRALLAGRQLTPAGETEIGGRRVLRLRGVRPERGLGRAIELAIDLEYLVDAETYVPVQVTYRVHPASISSQTGVETTRTTFETYELLPLARNEALLRIPDAAQRRVVKAR